MNDTSTNLAERDSSSIFGVSVRGWIVLIIISTVCIMNITNLVLVCLGLTSMTLQISEPLYSGFNVGIGFYLGQVMKKAV